MKGQSQITRFGYAWAGLVAAWSREASFRTEIVAIVAAGALFLFLRASFYVWIFWGVCATMMLSVELVNTAIEHVCDAVHPDKNSLIKIAKDCGAGAVLVVNVGVLISMGAVVWHLW